jgi:beta-RFAP synthase
VALKQYGNTYPNTCIRVSAPARLHLGFLDLNGDAGRKFGSIGLAISSHYTIIKVQRSEESSILGLPVNAKIIQQVETVSAKFYLSLGQNIADTEQTVSITIEQLIPQHAGLGSGTQLALAVGTALCRLYNIKATTADIAQQLGRGQRSGIGIATFEQGGFIIDGGNKPKHSTPPPLLAHHQLPDDWRMVLIMDPVQKGIHGQQEKNAFTSLAKFPLENSQAICHLSLMKLLPALVEKDIEQFGDAITQIQRLIGDHFAPAQGGRYTSNRVAQLLDYAFNQGHTGIAQSSWGPTGIVFVDSEVAASSLVTDLMTYVKLTATAKNQPTFTIAQADKSGATIEITTP